MTKTYMNCDVCGSSEYTSENPFVELRCARLSDPSDLSCVMAGHDECFGGGHKTPEQWDAYINSPEASENGHLFLS